MQKDTLQRLGRFSKTHGYGGVLVLLAENELEETLEEELAEVFVEVDGLLVPFPVEECTLADSNTAYVKLKFADTCDEAAELAHCEVYADTVCTPQEEGLEQWTGFAVHDAQCGCIGTITQIRDFKGNIVMQVTDGDRETLLALYPELVTTIDQERKILYINAPDGLIASP